MSNFDDMTNDMHSPDEAIPKKNEKFNTRLNPDIATPEQIADTDQKLINYMKKKGEDVAADRIAALSEKTGDPRQPKQIDANSFKLLTVNKKILAVLRKIQRDSIDEQDTTIHGDNSKKTITRIKKTSEKSSKSAETNGFGFLDIAGGALSGIMQALGAAFGLKKIKNLARDIKKTSNSTKIEKHSEKDSRKSEKDLEKDSRKSEKDLEKDSRKSEKHSEKDSRKIEKHSEKDSRKSEKDLEKDSRKIEKHSEKDSRKIEKHSEKDSRKIEKHSEKDSRKIEKGTRKSEKPVVKKTSKLLKRGMKSALRFAKFLGPLGVVIGGAMAVSDGIDGYEHAADSLGIDKDKLTTGNKVSAAAGSIISGITFGAIDNGDAAKGINNLFSNPTIEKYSKDKIISHHTLGDSEILDWKKLSTLPPDEIQKIIDIDDWSADDTTKLHLLKQSAVAAPQAIKDIERFDLQKTANADLPKINYTMRKPIYDQSGSTGSMTSHPNNSTNPDDYKTNELFKFYKVKESDFEKLQPNMLSNVKAMGAEYLDTYGEKIQINSAFRSVKEQAALKEKYGTRAAQPGMSMHNYGLAVDMNTKNAQKAIDAGLFDKYGFTRPVPGETWHVEPKNIDRVKIRTQGTKVIAKNDVSAHSVQRPPSAEFAESEKSPKDVVAAKKTSSIKPINAKDVTLETQQIDKMVKSVVVDKTLKEHAVFKKSKDINKPRAAITPVQNMASDKIKTNPQVIISPYDINTQTSILDVFSST